MTPLTVEERARIERVLGKTFRCGQSCGGLHHVPKLKWCHGWAEVNAHDGMSTYDFNQLTALVIGAHEEAVRVEILQGGPRRLKLLLHPRQREGDMTRRHPTIEKAIEDYRRVTATPVREVPA